MPYTCTLTVVTISISVFAFIATLTLDQVLKLWPNGLTSQCKSTYVFDLPSTCISFGHPLALTRVDLRWLGLTVVELKFVRKSTKVFYRLAIQRKSNTSWSQVICIYVKFATFCYLRNLRVDLRIRLTTHRKSVRKFWFFKLALTCIYLARAWC